MARSLAALILAATALLLLGAGCSAVRVKKYEGPAADVAQLALLYTMHLEGSQSKIFSLDGEELPYSMVRTLELRPGFHRVEAFNSPWPKDKPGFEGFLRRYDLNPDREYAIYQMAADLKAGFTYVPVPLKKGSLDAPAEQLCLAEEPHDARMARTNVSGELRYPSSEANLVGCSGRVPRPPGFTDRYPDFRRID